MQRIITPVIAISLFLLGCVTADGGSGYPDARPELEIRGELGDLCAQEGWDDPVACDSGLECIAAPRGREDSFCTKSCVNDGHCGAGGACVDGVCLEVCEERADWPWPCPWGEEIVVPTSRSAATCVCLPGRRPLNPEASS